MCVYRCAYSFAACENKQIRKNPQARDDHWWWFAKRILTSIATRVIDLTAIIAINQAMEKSNANNTTSDGKLDINLENLFYSKNSTRHFERNQKLLEKDSSSYGNMKSIALANEEDVAYIDNWSEQWKRKQINNKLYFQRIQQILSKDFFSDKPSSSENTSITKRIIWTIYMNDMDKEDTTNDRKEITSNKKSFLTESIYVMEQKTHKLKSVSFVLIYRCKISLRTLLKMWKIQINQHLRQKQHLTKYSNV